MADFQHPHDLGGDEIDQSGGGKRKRDEGGTQHRSKRNRYISIACNECKRRKIKCNGETPCQRCGNLNLECVYAPNCCSNSFKDSNEFQQLTATVASLQDQVNHLVDNVTSLRNALGQEEYPHFNDEGQYAQDPARAMQASQASMVIDPALQNRPSQSQSPQQSRFQGPTSSAFNFGVADSSLRSLGITSPEEAIHQGVLNQLDGQAHKTPVSQRPLHASKDPIWGLSKDEALRLCRVFEEENGLMYPVLDIDRIMRHASLLYQFLDAVSRTMSVQSLPGADAIQDEETDVLKLVLAIALVTEGAGQSELGQRLFENVQKNAYNRLMGNASLKDVQILTLTAIYHFHSDDEGRAWRIIGPTARLCLELGLHRSETYNTMFSDEQERAAALKLFWSIYVLDHRWSFGTGMSFALQDGDIDPQLPKPTDTSPYLTVMISFSNIASKVWKSVGSADSATGNNVFSKDEINWLDFQVSQWYREIPDHLRFIHPNSAEYNQHGGADPNEAGGRGLYRLRLLLYLRANQMRICIYRPLLHSSAAIVASASSGASAETAVNMAKDIIRILTHVNARSDVYRTQQTTFNHFLLSALAALFLAAAHAPAQFAESSRDEFYMALDLVRGLSANSYVSKRLWRTIRNLREIGPRLGLHARSNGPSLSTDHHGGSGGTIDVPTTPQHHDAQRSAAMAMAGLAGHPVDESDFFGNSTNTADSSSPVNRGLASAGSADDKALITSPNGMANELTSLFEAAGATSDGSAAVDTAGDIDAKIWGSEEELSRILTQLF